MIAIGVGRLLTVILSIVSLKIVTHTLSTENYGRWIIFNSITSFFVLYLISPIGHYINRHTHEWVDKKVLLKNLANFNLYLFLISMISGTVLFIDLNTLHLLSTNLSPTSTLIIPLGIFFITFNQTFVPIFNLIEERWAFIILTNLTSIISIVLSFTFTTYIFNNAEGWLLGSILANMIVGLYAFQSIRNKYPSSPDIHSKPNVSSYKKILSFSLPLFFVTGFGWLQSQGYRFFIEKSLGLESLAFFGAGYSVSAGIMASVESILNTYFLPNFYKRINAKEEPNLAWVYLIEKFFFPLFSTAIFLTAYSDFFVQIFLAKKYHHVAAYVAWGAFCESLRILSNLFQLLGHADKRTKTLIGPSLIGPISTISFLLIFINQYKLNSIGPSLFSGLSVTLLTYIYFYKNSLKYINTKKLAWPILSLIGLGVILYFFDTYIDISIINFTLGCTVYGIFNIFFLKEFFIKNNPKKGLP